jgi:hypothetical protein
MPIRVSSDIPANTNQLQVENNVCTLGINRAIASYSQHKNCTIFA